MTTLVADRPTPGTTPPWQFPPVQRLALDGLDVVAAHLPARTVVQAVLLLEAGAASDPAGAEGTAAVLSDAVLRGAGGRDEHDLAVAFERVGAVPGTGVRVDAAEVTVEAPAGLLAEALGLVAELVHRPTLDADQVTNVRDARMDRIRARQTDSGFRADRALPAALFAPASRLHHPRGGTLESLARVEPDDVAAFHAARWSTGRHTLVLAGDLTDLDLAEVAAPLAGATGELAPVVAGTELAAGLPRVAVVDVPGSVQSVLRLAVPAPAFGAFEDEAALEVAQAAVFGAFSSRLNQRLREELGYTYGAGGGFARTRGGGYGRIGANVRTEVTADAVAESLQVLRTAVADGLTDDEVTQARDNLVRRYPVRYDGAGAVAGALVQRVVHGLPDGERDQRLEELRAVDTAAASAALVEALPLDQLLVCVAGEGQAITEGLSGLGLGPAVEVP